jgi:aminobenzoyl-glutamate utilization protein B
MKLNEAITEQVVANGHRLNVDLSRRHTMLGMSDFGNVSHRIPATHFSTATWPPGVTAHTEAAVAASCQPRAFDAAIAAAKIEAMTAIDVLVDPGLVSRARQEFEQNDLGELAEIP